MTSRTNITVKPSRRDDSLSDSGEATRLRAVPKTKSSGRKDAILASAGKMFYTKGFHATTIQDIATDVGMLKGSLYYYIKSKEDLLYELLTDVLLRGEANIEQAIVGTVAPLEKLRRALKAQIRFIVENQVTVGVFLHEFGTLSGSRGQCVRKVMQRYQNRLVEIIREGQATGEFVNGSPWLQVNGILGMCNWIYRWHHGSRSPALETMQKTYIELVLHGIVRR